MADNFTPKIPLDGSTNWGENGINDNFIDQNTLNQQLIDELSGLEDTKVKASISDTTPNYLNDKIEAGDNITTSIQNVGLDETLRIDSKDENIKVSSNDTTSNYLTNKISGGTNISITEQNDGSNESLLISYTGGDALTYDTMANLVADLTTEDGDIVDLLGFYSKGDGSYHKRKVSSSDDGTGILLDNALYANLAIYNVINVKDLGAKGDNVQDDSPYIQKALNTGGIIFFPSGTYKCDSQLDIKSNTILTGSYAVIQCNAVNGLYIDGGETNIRIENLKIYGDGTNIGINFDGTSEINPFDGQIREVKIDNCYLQAFLIGIRCSYLRKAEFSRIHLYTSSGVLYTGKSAEVNISNSYFVNDNSAGAGTYGVKTETLGASDYPEGLTMESCLFFRFETNVYLEDIYVAFFSNCYLDGAGGPLQNVYLDYQTRNQGVQFDNCWIFANGIIFQPNGASSPKEFRAAFNDCFFDSIPSISVLCYPWTHDVSLRDIRAVGLDTGELFLICNNQNNNIEAVNCNLKFYGASCFQFKGVGEKNTLHGIRVNNLTSPYYFEYAVDFYDCERINAYNGWQDVLVDATIIAKGDTVASITTNLSEGNYICTLQTGINITTAGFIAIEALDSDVGIVGSTNTYVPQTGNQTFSFTWLLQVKKGKNATISAKSLNATDGFAGTINDLFGRLSLMKM